MLQKATVSNTDLLQSLPDLLNADHLVSLGLFKSPEAVYASRKRKLHHPDYLKIGRKYLYPKSSILKFINERMSTGSNPSSI